MGRRSVSHTGAHVWTGLSSNEDGPDAMAQAAYDAGLAIGRAEVEAMARPAPSTTMRPRIEARSIFDEWEPSCDG